MRKFHVTYREYTKWDYYYYSVIISLNEGEKANISTFRDKLKGKCFGDNYKEILSWSLIEDE